MLLIWISVGLLVFSFLALLTLLGCWTYTDAKERSDKPEVWTLIVLLAPNFIGLVIYLLIGRAPKAKGSEPIKNKFFAPLIVFVNLTIASFIVAITVSVLYHFY